MFFKRKKILRIHIQKNIGGGGCVGGDGMVLLNMVIDPFSGGGGRRRGGSISSISSKRISIKSVLLYAHAWTAWW
jgi:hypothetical protein